MFARWGRFVYRTRWWMLAFSAVLLGLSIGGVLTGGNLAANGNFGSDLPAGKAFQLIQQEMRPNQAASSRHEITRPFRSRMPAASDDPVNTTPRHGVAPRQPAHTVPP